MAGRLALVRGVFGSARALRSVGRDVRSTEARLGSCERRSMAIMHQPLGQVPATVDRMEIAAKYQSDAMELISEVAPAEVEGGVAACDGGGGPLGHPIEYIKLDNPYPSVCKYCGLRFVSKGHGKHH